MEFGRQYGDTSFPEQYPDGTSININWRSLLAPRYDEWFKKYAKQRGEAYDVGVKVNLINIAEPPSTLSAAMVANLPGNTYGLLPAARFQEPRGRRRGPDTYEIARLRGKE